MSEKCLQPSNGELVGFSRDKVPILGYVRLQTTLGDFPNSQTLDIQYLVEGTIATVHADHKEARQCCNASLSLPKAEPKEERCNAVYNAECLPPLAELDPRTNTEDRPTPAEQLEKVPLNLDP
ncbi:hypothetical protein PIB30_053427 [Stylosanthes scabra]|uniref:Uncharacterized protein n=1 Tax=Stylosanthes scabra TaxID=79078 RepID=A0ABU6ZH74_9FABA|nr:hypothetical protein [Stylosanthes scabra]